jgi:hypothetical protein
MCVHVALSLATSGGVRRRKIEGMSEAATQQVGATLLPFLVHLYYIWIFRAVLFLLACAVQLFCALAVSVLFSCLFVLADSPGCQRPSCLLDSFLSGFLSLLLNFSGAVSVFCFVQM